MSTANRRLVAVVVAAVACAAPVLLALAFATPAAIAWSAAVGDAVSPLDSGVWRLLRGGLRWLAAPATVVLVGWCLLRSFRTGERRRAWLAVLIGAGSFATTEAFKLGLLPFPGYGPDGERDLSGHVAMAGSALVVIVLTAPAARRAVLAWLGAAILLGACLGVVLARWHDAGDVVIPASVTIAWIVLGWVVLTWSPEGPYPRRHGWGTDAVVAVLAGAGCCVLMLADVVSAVGPVTSSLAAVTLASLSATVLVRAAALELAAAADEVRERTADGTPSGTERPRSTSTRRDVRDGTA